MPSSTMEGRMAGRKKTRRTKSTKSKRDETAFFFCHQTFHTPLTRFGRQSAQGIIVPTRSGATAPEMLAESPRSTHPLTQYQLGNAKMAESHGNRFHLSLFQRVEWIESIRYVSRLLRQTQCSNYIRSESTYWDKANITSTKSLDKIYRHNVCLHSSVISRISNKFCRKLKFNRKFIHFIIIYSVIKVETNQVKYSNMFRPSGR